MSKITILVAVLFSLGALEAAQAGGPAAPVADSFPKPVLTDEMKAQMKADGVPTPDELDAIFKKVESQSGGFASPDAIDKALKAAGFKVPELTEEQKKFAKELDAKAKKMDEAVKKIMSSSLSQEEKNKAIFKLQQEDMKSMPKVNVPKGSVSAL